MVSGRACSRRTWSRPSYSRGLPIGSRAPLIRLPDLEGNFRSLSDFLGKRVLLVFWDPNDADSRCVIRRLTRMHGRGILSVQQVLLVGRGSLDDNRATLRGGKIPFIALIQYRWEAAEAYMSFVVPMAYVVDDSGSIASELTVGCDDIVSLAPSP